MAINGVRLGASHLNSHMLTLIVSVTHGGGSTPTHVVFGAFMGSGRADYSGEFKDHVSNRWNALLLWSGLCHWLTSRC